MPGNGGRETGRLGDKKLAVVDGTPTEPGAILPSRDATAQRKMGARGSGQSVGADPEPAPPSQRKRKLARPMSDGCRKGKMFDE
jgi:hypothetical protein